jgi:DNA-binding NarL/FixJ family response regulator
VLIEDHQALREGLELLLSREGCDVVGTAGDAAAGQMLIDPKRRIMLYTGSADEELLFSGLDSGARGYALKDGWQRELVEALELVAQGGTYVDPRLRPALLSRRSTERLPSLSNREREILDLLAQGMTGEQVAEHLVLSAETIKTHIRNAMNKLEAHTRVHAIAIALREGFISPPAGAGVARG